MDLGCNSVDDTIPVLLYGQNVHLCRYNANRAALVQSRIKALERMAEVEQVIKCVE